MKNISLDIETYSDIDLQKSGVYRYVESPEFDILLFSYSINGGEVETIDLASGELIPLDIIHALLSNEINKWAFNAQFERICLSEWLKRRGYSLKRDAPFGSEPEPLKYLNPESWYCSMVWSAYCGLPLSLEKVGEVLGLDKQKLSAGKELIRYFSMPCTPTKSNGQRTGNLPRDAPEKWHLYKLYNRRDVETELEIQKKLAR